MDIDASKTPDTRTCYNCGEKGHLHYNCPKPKKQSVKATGKEASTEGASTAASLARIAEQLAKMEANWGPKQKEPKEEKEEDF